LARTSKFWHKIDQQRRGLDIVCDIDDFLQMRDTSEHHVLTIHTGIMEGGVKVICVAGSPMD
jgi:hypothetical protein